MDNSVLAQRVLEQFAQLFFFFFVFCLRAAPEVYGDSQAIAGRPRPQPQQRQIRAMSANYTTAHGNAGSLTP